MNLLSRGLYLAPSQYLQMQDDVLNRAEEEACGLVIGDGNRARLIIPITNMLHSTTRFRMDPEEQLKAFLLAEEMGAEILAVYHSHPLGISHPSPTDIDELTFPGIVYLIWFQAVNEWFCRAYLMQDPTTISEVPLIISTNPGQ